MCIILMLNCIRSKSITFADQHGESLAEVSSQFIFNNLIYLITLTLHNNHIRITM